MNYYRLRDQFGGLKAEAAKKLKRLEKNTLQLNKLLTKAELEKAVLNELAEVVVQATAETVSRHSRGASIRHQ